MHSKMCPFGVSSYLISSTRPLSLHHHLGNSHPQTDLCPHAATRQLLLAPPFPTSSLQWNISPISVLSVRNPNSSCPNNSLCAHLCDCSLSGPAAWIFAGTVLQPSCHTSVMASSPILSSSCPHLHHLNAMLGEVPIAVPRMLLAPASGFLAPGTFSSGSVITFASAAVLCWPPC